MTSASVLSVWRFPTEIGAQRAVHPLAWSDGDRLRIADAAVVSWRADRERPAVWQATELAGERAFAGAFWGMLVGLLILLPLSETIETRHPGTEVIGAVGVERSLSRLGLDGAFVDAVRANVGPGCSALFLFDVSPDSSSLRSAMPPQAREVARQVMTDDQMAGLHAGFDG